MKQQDLHDFKDVAQNYDLYRKLSGGDHDTGKNRKTDI